MKKLLLLLLLPLLLEANEEGKRFFEEYLAARDFKVKNEKLAAALTLAPMNPRYRRAEIEFRRYNIKKSQDWNVRLGELDKQLTRCKKFRADFPDEQGEFVIHTFFGGLYLDFLHGIPESERKRLALLLQQEIRPFLLTESRRYRHYQPDEPGTMGYLRNEYVFFRRTSQADFFCDQELWLTTRLAEGVRLFEMTLAFAAKYPERRGELMRYQLTTIPMLRELLVPNYGKDTAQAVRSYAKASGRFISLAEQSGFPAAQADAAYLRFLQKMFLPEALEEKQVKQALEEYFSAYDRIFPDGLQMRQTPGNWDNENWVWFDREINTVFQLLKLPPCAAEFRLSWQQAHGKTTEWGLFLQALLHHEVSNVVHLAEVGWRFNRERMTINATGNRFAFFASQWNQKPETETALRALSVNFELNSGRWDVLQKTHSAKLIALAKNGEELFLALELSDNRIRIIKWQEPEFKIDISGGNFPVSYDSSLNFTALAADDSFLILAERQNGVWTYDRRSGKVKLIDDLHDGEILFTVLQNGILYLASGKRLQRSGHLTLQAITPDGRGRRMLGSTRRSEKQNAFDFLPPGSLRDMIAGREGEILLLVDRDYRTELFSFREKTQTFEKLLVFPFESLFGSLWMQGDQLYICCGGFGARIYGYSLEEKKARFIFAQSAVSDDTPQYAFGGSYQLQRPWRFRNNERELWCANSTPAMIPLEAMDKTPFLLLPKCGFLEDLGERGMLFLGTHGYFIVRRKQP